MSAHELMQFACLIQDLLVNRLSHGDASDLAQSQVPAQWMLIALNDLLAAVRTNCSESLEEAA